MIRLGVVGYGRRIHGVIEHCLRAVEPDIAVVGIVDPDEAAVLARLAPRDRLVMTLMYLEQCTVAQIAELTGWSESLVKVQAFRARRRLRRLCETKGEPR